MYSPFEIEVVEVVVGGGSWSGRGEVPYLQSPVIAGSSKVFVRRVKADALDMTLVTGDCLEFLKCMT